MGLSGTGLAFCLQMKGFSILPESTERQSACALQNQGNGIRQRHFSPNRKKTVIDAQIGNKIGILDLGISGRQIKPQGKNPFPAVTNQPRMSVSLSGFPDAAQIASGRMR